MKYFNFHDLRCELITQQLTQEIEIILIFSSKNLPRYGYIPIFLSYLYISIFFILSHLFNLTLLLL